MPKDAIVEEVRRIRHEIERECEGDADKLFAYFRTAQAKLSGRLVRREPKFLELARRKETAG